MKKVTYFLTALLLSGCGGDYNVDMPNTEHVLHISLAETWREVCADRFNIYDYPVEAERDVLRAECNRAFAAGEETLDFPELPTREELL